MKNLKNYLFSLLLFLFVGLANGQTNLPELQTFQVSKAILDLKIDYIKTDVAFKAILQ